jgi:hypothetical protein
MKQEVTNSMLKEASEVLSEKRKRVEIKQNGKKWDIIDLSSGRKVGSEDSEYDATMQATSQGYDVWDE